jgi:DNA-binding XRE family transcriptional regulator
MTYNPVQTAIDRIGSQEELAKLIGVSRPTVGYWKRQGVIPVKYLVQVSEAVSIPIEKLMNTEQLKVFRVAREVQS